MLRVEERSHNHFFEGKEKNPNLPIEQKSVNLIRDKIRILKKDHHI